jgi:hypothetical protein
MDKIKCKKMPNEFICEKCDFKCYKRSNFEIHLGTAKHRRIKMDKKEEITTYNCECGKKYNYQSGLCKHKKKCTYKTQEELLAETLKQQLEEQRRRHEEQKEEQLKRDEEQKEEQRKRDEEQRKLLQEQKEEQQRRDEEHKQQIEILSDKISGMSLVTNHITNNVNSNNNVVIDNLNYFLNTQCKDAMDLSTFLRSIKVVKEDVDYFLKHGYLKGMEMMLQKYLYSLKVEERPIHCTDKKRKVIYYKDGDCWKKDTEKLQLKHIINNIECKNVMYIEDIHSKRRPEELERFESKAYQWYLKSIEATTGGTHGTANINHARALNRITEEIYVKVVVKQDLIR